MRILGDTLTLGVLCVASLCLGFLVTRTGVATVALDGPRLIRFGPADEPGSASPLSGAAVPDLRAMVERGAISLQALKAEVLRRMRAADSLLTLDGLNRQLSSALAQISQRQAAAPPDAGQEAPPAARPGAMGGAPRAQQGGGPAAAPRAASAPREPAAEAEAGGAPRPRAAAARADAPTRPPAAPASNAPPVSAAWLDAMRRAREQPEREPVNVTRLIPTLVFIGNPKCGSTFLWDCVRSGIFDPSNVCGRDSSTWRTCARRHLITAFGPRKEFNFYDRHFYLGHGWGWYVGPEIPIASWERTGPAWALDAPRAMDAPNRRGAFTPACRKAQADDPAVKGVCRKPTERWRCEYSEACVPIGPVAGRELGVKSVLLDHALPRRADVSPYAVSADPSINYFLKAGPRAMRWMYEGAVDPPALRFVLLLRDPLERTYSNWLMFRQWQWEDEPNFTRAAEVEINDLRACDPATFADPAGRLPALPQAELDAYHASCLLGGKKHLLNHVRGSMYAVGALQWFRWFAPKQFLVLDNDEVRALKAEELLGRIAAHTGLHLELPQVGNFRPSCEGLQHSGDARKHYHKHSYEPGARKLLRDFFRPYNAMLYERLPQLKVRWPDV